MSIKQVDDDNCAHSMVALWLRMFLDKSSIYNLLGIYGGSRNAFYSLLMLDLKQTWYDDIMYDSGLFYLLHHLTKTII